MNDILDADFVVDTSDAIVARLKEQYREDIRQMKNISVVNPHLKRIDPLYRCWRCSGRGRVFSNGALQCCPDCSSSEVVQSSKLQNNGSKFQDVCEAFNIDFVYSDYVFDTTLFFKNVANNMANKCRLALEQLYSALRNRNDNFFRNSYIFELYGMPIENYAYAFVREAYESEFFVSPLYYIYELRDIFSDKDKLTDLLSSDLCVVLVQGFLKDEDEFVYFSRLITERTRKNKMVLILTANKETFALRNYAKNTQSSKKESAMYFRYYSFVNCFE